MLKILVVVNHALAGQVLFPYERDKNGCQSVPGKME